MAKRIPHSPVKSDNRTSITLKNLPSAARKDIARQAKALVVLAFRNGPIEDVHSGEVCPKCYGESRYSPITQEEMRQIMKSAVDRMYTLLTMKQTSPQTYEALLSFGELYTTEWDDPVFSMDEFIGKNSSRSRREP